jgi:hypothetical protein
LPIPQIAEYTFGRIGIGYQIKIKQVIIQHIEGNAEAERT